MVGRTLGETRLRRAWPTACGIRARPTAAYNLHDELELAEAGASSTIPCPGWCELPDGHRYDVPTLDSTSRMHEREVAARDGAPTVKIWALDSLEKTNRELVEPEVGTKNHKRAEPPVRHVPAFTEAMLEAPRIVEGHQADPGSRVFTDEEMDQALQEMAQEPTDVELVLRGVDAILADSPGTDALPTEAGAGTGLVLTDADDPNLHLSPETNGATLTLARGEELPTYAYLDADDMLTLAKALIRMRVLANDPGYQLRSAPGTT